MKIFVSYTTRDCFISRDYLESVDKIVSRYADSFIDLIHNKAEKKQEFLKRELVKSDILLLISTVSISLSPWVAWEINQAKIMGIQIINIPIKESRLSNSLIEINDILSSKLIDNLDKENE